MTREEALARGMEVHETKHSMKRRCPWHDYRKKGTYMLTLVVDGRVPLLGVLKGNAEASLGSPEAPRIVCSELGEAILRDEICKINRFYPQVEVWKVCIMPDHIHMIVRIKEDLPERKHLGMVVRGFKTGCSRAWWRLGCFPSGKTEGTVAGAEGTAARAEGTAARAEGTVAGTEGTVAGTEGTAAGTEGTVAGTEGTATGAKGTAAGTEGTAAGTEGTATGTEGAATGTEGTATGATVPSAFPEGAAEGVAEGVAEGAAEGAAAAFPEGRRPVLFEAGYNDKILMHEGQLDNWKAYLDDNPRRLLLKRQNPQLFTVLCGMEVAERRCQIVGNRFLLNIPDKMAVIVHRRYTDEENARLREEWLACGERGGVLVSAAISPKEKEVLREAMNRGYRIVLLRENGFPRLYKPSGEAFDACCEGLLLQISPWEYHMEKKTITRAQCLELNAMAERIAGKG